MIDEIVQCIYHPYLKRISEIKTQAWALNKNALFHFKNLGISDSGILPNAETSKYLAQFEEKFSPIIKEKAQVHAWLLKTLNRLYNQTSIYSLLPKEISPHGVHLDFIATHDRLVILQAMKDQEYTLIRKRLLLRTMQDE